MSAGSTFSGRKGSASVTMLSAVARTSGRPATKNGCASASGHGSQEAPRRMRPQLTVRNHVVESSCASLLFKICKQTSDHCPFKDIFQKHIDLPANVEQQTARLCRTASATPTSSENAY